MADVRILKLKNGEELIASTVVTRDGTYSLTNPLLIAMGEQNLVFIPYMPYAKIAEDGLVIRDTDVLFICYPQDALVDDYYRATSKVVVPKRQRPLIVQ
ncbi:MAG: hypothetical protein DDT26_00798 [Dehalococcoidia bacterium]|nr:hypothetical protein [Chloroflexota bacterium]